MKARIIVACVCALFMACSAWAVDTPVYGTQNVFQNNVTIGSTTAGKNLTVYGTRTSIHTFTDANWNEDGATWTMGATGPLAHVAGNTTTVTATLTEAIVQDTTYRVTITGTGGGGTATYTLGGITGTTIAASGAIAIEDFITASTTGGLIITPASASTVSITSITVEKLTDNTGDVNADGNIRINSPLKDQFGRVMSYVGKEEFGIGNQALYRNTGANSNAFGMYALYSNTGAYSNAFGNNALNNNTGANSNAFGYNALYQNTGAYSNAFGYYALRTNTGADSNAFGYNALQSNTGANSNAFGNYALQSNTGAYSNAFGYYALQSNTGAYSNAFGYYALRLNTGAYSNAFGNYALQSNTGANSNAFGYYAMRYNQKDNNTAIGYNAWGSFLTNTSGAKTFAFGDVAIATDRITVASHGFGATNAYVNLLYTQGTEAIGGLTTATVYQVKIIDANTVEFRTSGRGTDITSTGAGTGHTLTPQYAYTNTTVIGANAVPTADNQVVIGTASTTNTQLFGPVYHNVTYTDASNYERGVLTGTAGSNIELKAETAGTGGDNLDVVLTPAGTGSVKVKGALVKMSSTTNTGGGLARNIAEATGTPSGTTTYFDIALSIPTGSILQGCQLRVDTALTAGETWGAAFNGGSSTSLAGTGQAVAKNTKVNTLVVPEVATNTTNVRITRDSGNFTNAVGVVRAVCYYESLVALSDNP